MVTTSKLIDELDARAPREMDSRAKTERPKSWQPASTLPDPDKQPGYAYRWIRASTLSQADPRNMSAKLREGWEPVRIEEQPKFAMFVDQSSKFKDNVEVGGLLLCKTPVEFVEQRKSHFDKRNQDQMESVNNNFMRENNPKMPLFSERKSSSSFGKGK